MSSPYPWQYLKTQLVKVFDANMNFIDVWRDAPLLDGFKEAINSAATPLKVKLPRRFDNFDEGGTPGALGSITRGNRVQYWLFGPNLPTAGFLRFQGVIDAYEPTIDGNGEEYVSVSVTPLGAAVGDNALVGTRAFGTPNAPLTYDDPITMFHYWFTNNDPTSGLAYSSPLTWDSTNPTSSGVVTQYTFQNQTLADIWNTLILLLPTNWYWRCNTDGTVTLNVAPISAQNTFIVGRHCVQLLYAKDWTLLKNNIYVQGGADANGITITSSRQGSDISTFGNRQMLVQEGRIVDYNTADMYAEGLLTINDRVTYRAQLRVFDYRGDANVGLGYDIETLQVGQTCTLVVPAVQAFPQVPPSKWDEFYWDRGYWDYAGTSTESSSTWDVMDWDQGYWDFGTGTTTSQIVQIAALTYHFDYVDLELVALRPSQDAAIIRLQAQFQNHSLV